MPGTSFSIYLKYFHISFCLFINSFVQNPVTLTRVLLEFNGVILITWEKGLKFFKYNGGMNLKRVDRKIKNSSSYMNRVSNNNDFQNITEFRGLVNLISNSEQFHFWTCNVDYMIEHKNSIYLWPLLKLTSLILLSFSLFIY